MRKRSISTNKLAEICGVSQGTVDRALNDREGINPQTKERILKIAKEYGYRPNIHASAIAGGKSMLIGIIVFDLNNRYFTSFITEFEKHCSTCGYSIVTMFSNKDPKRELECIKSLYDIAVDGIVLCPINKGADFESFLLSLDTPVITLGNKLTNVPSVGVNDLVAMLDATNFVISQGYEDLIYVMPSIDESVNSSAQQHRLLGFKEAAEQHNVKYTVTDINEAVKRSVLKNKTAYICSTDVYAMKLAAYAKSHGAALIGFDDVDLIDYLELGFDSVACDTNSIAADALKYIISGELPQIAPHYIKQRGSI